MVEEEIILLIKEGKHSEAIKRYIDKNDFDKAEKFCLSQDKSLGLLTTLLTLYFEYYEEKMKQKDSLINQGKTSEGLKVQEEAKKFREQALMLMRGHSTKTHLDPLKVLNLIPEDWDIIKEDEYDLVSYLSSVFDHLLTIEENSKIAENLGKME